MLLYSAGLYLSIVLSPYQYSATSPMCSAVWSFMPAITSATNSSQTASSSPPYSIMYSLYLPSAKISFFSPSDKLSNMLSFICCISALSQALWTFSCLRSFCGDCTPSYLSKILSSETLMPSIRKFFCPSNLRTAAPLKNPSSVPSSLAFAAIALMSSLYASGLMSSYLCVPSIFSSVNPFAESSFAKASRSVFGLPSISCLNFEMLEVCFPALS